MYRHRLAATAARPCRSSGPADHAHQRLQGECLGAVYRPIGEVHAIIGTVTRILRFPGQYFLFETGRAHNWHRTYDATIGRYLQADPLGFVGGSPNYTYVSNSPTTYVDPTGQCPWCIAALLRGATDLAVQLVFNGGDLGCVGWKEVAISAALTGTGVG